MKKIALSILLMAFAAAPTTSVLAQVDYTKPEKYNPKNDPDVERGYRENQKEHAEKQEREDRREKGEIERPYNVDKSGDTTENRKSE